MKKLNMKICPCWFLVVLRIISITILSIALIMLFTKYLYKSREHFNQEQLQSPETIVPQMTYNYKYLTKEEFTQRVSLSDFFSSMNEYDLIARSSATPDVIISSGEQYKNTYISSYEEMTEIEKNILNKVVEEANTLLSSYKNLQMIEWRFAKVKDTIEEGLPHTITDMIVLNKNVLMKSQKELVKTLIHEKIHIYQRMNSMSAKKLVSRLGFEPLLPNEFMSLNKDVLNMRRSNPDLDRNTYYHVKSNLIIKQLYNSTTPTSILDSKAVGIPRQGSYAPLTLTNDLLGLPKSVYCQLEHPYEIMACIMSDMITSSTYVEEHRNNNYVNKSLSWMHEELKTT